MSSVLLSAIKLIGCLGNGVRHQARLWELLKEVEASMSERAGIDESCLRMPEIGEGAALVTSQSISPSR